MEGFRADCSNDPQRGEFIILDRTRYDVSSELTILGCTLWSQLDSNHLESLSLGLSDFHRIKDFNTTTYEQVHRQDMVWLNTALAQVTAEDPCRRVIVFSHHAPTIAGTADPAHVEKPNNSGFATELSNRPLWGLPIVLWAFGHTHWTCDFQRRGIQVYSNQRGYKDGADSDYTKFRVDKVLHL